jgi:two-component system cell cycle sensor histidine kinase/response regulator CckA
MKLQSALQISAVPEEVHALLIDDSGASLPWLQGLLSQLSCCRFNLERVASQGWALRVLNQAKYDIYFIDWDNFPGEKLLHDAVFRGISQPIIFLTSHPEALRTSGVGADFLLKSEITPSLLDRSIRYAFELNRARRTESALRESETKYRNLVETSGDMIWSVDEQGRFTFVNQAVRQIHGYEPEEMIGKPFYDFMSPEVAKKDLEVFSQILSGKPFFQYESEHLRKDGTPVKLSFNAIVVRDEQGNVRGSTGTATDITERKRAEEAWRIIVEGTASATAETYFRSLCYHLAKVIGTKYSFVGKLNNDDPQTVDSLAVWWQDHFTDNFTYVVRGTPSETVIGKSLQVYPEDLNKIFPEDKHASITAAQGYMGAPIFDQQGRPLGIVAVWDDCPLDDWAPARSIMTLFAARAGAELERLQAEQESRRLHRQLMQSQKMEAIGQLAAGVAHDLNNALGAVVGHLQLMNLSPGLTPDIAASVHVALSGCERASSLIEQLLGFSRQGKYNLRDISIRQAVSDTIKFLGRVISKDIKIIEQSSGEDLFIKADEGQIQQALINLILNAQHAMLQGGAITFDFSSAKVKDPERFNPKAEGTSYVVVSVRDTGSGIEPDDIEKIFEPFFTTKKDGSGTGLGLSMVYGIVHNHGGWIDVNSELGKGTTFTLYFPRVARNQKDERSDHQELNASGNGMVLVIDDEPALVELTSVFLRRAGLEVIGFTSPREAIEWFKQHHAQVDLVVLDMKMPEVDGAQCFEQLRVINPNAQVAILSGYIQDDAVQKLLQKGALKFFQKPLRYPELAQWVSEVTADNRPKSADH